MIEASDKTRPDPAGNLDTAEVARFEKIAAEWWDPTGKFRPLHQIGPPRISFVRDQAIAHFGLTSGGLRPLTGLDIIDIGCGGGLVSEPLARLGGNVTGIDPGESNIRVAEAHALGQRLPITYRPSRVEDLAAEGKSYDLVVCLEVVEHVPDVGQFITSCASVLKPGGLAIFSTINRTLKAYALAIVGAEYVLGWLPRGTHQWDRFVTPDELGAALRGAGLQPGAEAGIVFNPLRDEWSLSGDTSVNYLAAASKRPS